MQKGLRGDKARGRQESRRSSSAAGLGDHERGFESRISSLGTRQGAGVKIGILDNTPWEGKYAAFLLSEMMATLSCFPL